MTHGATNASASDDALPAWHAAVNRVVRTLDESAVERDRRGGVPKHERDVLRDSGLLMLSVPTAFGGLGATWQQTLDVVRRFAQVDSSVAHVFAFHHLLLATVRLFGQPAQWEPWLVHTGERRWFWGNALNPLDKTTRAEAAGDGYVFAGRKSFCSGAGDSDMLLASALDDQQRLVIGVVPTRREGISVLDDWDNIGQRQTDSGSVLFDQVRVAGSEVLRDPGPLSTPFACLRPLLAQLILANVYLGLGQGALEQARSFTSTQARPWLFSPAATASEDPYVLAHYGEFWLALEGARALLGLAMTAFDNAWQRGTALDDSQRADVAIAVAAAKVASTRAGLEVAHRMFEVTGARATTAALRLDRFWRNLRVHTLHDPVDYKVRELGDWALNSQPPKPSFYS